MKLRHGVGRLSHRIDDVVGESGWVGAREPHALEAFDGASGPQQLGESVSVTELDAVRVHVLAEKSHLDGTLINHGLDLREDVPGPAVSLLAAQGRHDTEGAGVVAPDGDGDPRAVRRFTPGGQCRREHVE